MTTPNMSSGGRFFSVEGRIALVTGARRGIGRGIAEGFAEYGGDVALVDAVGGAELEQAADAIRRRGRRAWVYVQDLAQTEQLEALAERVWRDCDRIDVLYNNAGIAFLETYDRITLEHWRKIMAVNADAAFFLSQAVAKRMIAAGIKGRIINSSSVNGFMASEGLAHYNASKGAMEMLTRSLAVELGRHGITVNSLCPGNVNTRIGEDFPPREGVDDWYKLHVPLGRIAEVEDIVGPAIFLASRAGAFMNGQHIILDGGLLAQQLPVKPHR